MNGNCHFIFGATVSTMVAINLEKLSVVLPNITCSPETTSLLILGGILGGVMPDMDNPKSYIGRLSRPISTYIGKLGGLFGKKGKYHRGILHDPFIYICGLALSYIYFPYLIGLFIGGVSHIYLDLFNPVGVPVMFGIKRLRLGKILSGSKQAIRFTWLNIILCLLIGVSIKIGLMLA